MLRIRPYAPDDADAVWRILQPVIRAGEVFALPREMPRAAALAYWIAGDHTPFVAEDNAEILGAYYIRPNQQGGGAHVANAGYATAPHATGRGIARAMCEDSLDRARAENFTAMQFNFVISTNIRAINLWKRCGFTTAARLPAAFHHPTLGYVDALIMFRPLSHLPER